METRDIIGLLALTICLLIGSTNAHSEEQIQKPVPPVPTEAEHAAQPETNGGTPQSNVPPSPSPVEKVQTTEKMHAETKGDQGHADTKSTKWTDPIAIFSGLLFIVGGLQWWTYRAIHNSTKIIERAYVVMSHSPPGLIIDKTSGQFWVQMQVGNFGRTPARVVRKSLWYQVLPKDNPPPDVVAFRNESKRENASNIRLVAQDKIVFVFSGKADDALNSRDETKRLWLYGFVDYIDQFGKSDFAPYIRAYDPRLDVQPPGMSNETFAGRSNLVFED